NPVHRLVRALSRIAAYQTPLVVTPAVERYFRDLSTIETDQGRRAALADVRAALRDSAAVRFLTGDLTYNALLRNTISITGLQGSDKTNVIPPVARAALDVRLLPGQDPQACLADAARTGADSGGVHGNNGRVSLDDLTFGVHFLYDVVARLVAK